MGWSLYPGREFHFLPAYLLQYPYQQTVVKDREIVEEEEGRVGDWGLGVDSGCRGRTLYPRD